MKTIYPVLAAMSFTMAILASGPALAKKAKKNCREDFNTHCPDMKMNRKNILACLKDKKDELSEGCQAKVEKLVAWEEKKNAKKAKIEAKKAEMDAKKNDIKAKAKGKLKKFGISH